MDALDDNQLSRVHYIDCIMEFTEPIEILAVQSAYRQCIKDKNWASMPPPFGFKECPPDETKLQINVRLKIRTGVRVKINISS